MTRYTDSNGPIDGNIDHSSGLRARLSEGWEIGVLTTDILSSALGILGQCVSSRSA